MSQKPRNPRTLSALSSHIPTLPAIVCVLMLCSITAHSTTLTLTPSNVSNSSVTLCWNANSMTGVSSYQVGISLGSIATWQTAGLVSYYYVGG